MVRRRQQTDARWDEYGILVEHAPPVPIESGWLRYGANSDEPQLPQNHFSPPPGGCHIRSMSSPATIRNPPGAG